MPISFNQISPNIRVPGAYFEVDNSRAYRGVIQLPTKVLVLGNRLSTGSVTAGTLKLITSVGQAAEFFGVGSQLHNMFDVIKANDKLTETWAVAFDDEAAGVKAAGTIAFGSSAATANGTLYLYVAGRRVLTAVLKGDNATTIGAAVAAAINADITLPVTATADTGTVTITARHKGEFGNEIDLRFNYRGEDFGAERFPAGVTPVITALSGGTTNPTITTTLANLPDELIHHFILPYTDSTNLDAMYNELDSRWGPFRQLEGHSWTARRATVGDLSTFGNSRNSQFNTTMGFYDSPTPAYEWAAAFGIQVASYGTIDPARPFKTIPLKKILPPPKASLFTLEEQNILLYDGISTFTVSPGGEVLIQQAITNYQKNGSNVIDPSYLKVNTMLTLTFYRQTLRNRLLTKFPRYKLMDDTARISAGQAAVRPKDIKVEIIAWYQQMEDMGLAENMETFKNELIVERNSNDPNRVDALIPPDLANQLDVIAGQFQFLL